MRVCVPWILSIICWSLVDIGVQTLDKISNNVTEDWYAGTRPYDNQTDGSGSGCDCSEEWFATGRSGSSCDLGACCGAAGRAGSWRQAESGWCVRLARAGVSGARLYRAETADGALLGAVRCGRRGGAVVLLAPGLLQAGAAWLDAGRAALPALLAPHHDLWLLSARGSDLSRVPSWGFSADEIGRRDLPALIDLVRAETGAARLAYIGFSQGAGTFYIMCSELPHYCDRVHLMIALAPAARISGMKSNLKYVFEYFAKAEEDLYANGIYQAMPQGGLISNLQVTLCQQSVKLCELIKDFYDGTNPGSVEQSTFLVAAEGFPAGTSVRTMARYGQHLRSRNFQKYDFGPEKNLLRYGRKTPPTYNLSAVTVPTVVMYGKSDLLVDVSNTIWLIKRLPNLVEAVEVEDPNWTHMDFTMSKNIPRYVYPTIKKYLDKYSL